MLKVKTEKRAGAGAKYKILKDECLKALELLSLKSGVSFDFKNLRVEQEHFELHCKSYGLEPKHYKAEFSQSGKTFILIGFNLNSFKYCFKAMEKDTKKIRNFTPSEVKGVINV